MGRYEFDGPSTEPACERCGVALTDEHWARLKALHQGTAIEGYRDSEMRVCVDCVSAIGMLELESTDGGAGGRLRDRPLPVDHGGPSPGEYEADSVQFGAVEPYPVRLDSIGGTPIRLFNLLRP